MLMESAQDDASFVMYYAARSNASGPFTQCIGAATSETIEGPYTPLPSPIVCPLRYDTSFLKFPAGGLLYGMY